MKKHVTNHDLDRDCAVFTDEEVSNEASVINDSSTREKVPVLIEVRDAEDTGHEEINDSLDEDASDEHMWGAECRHECGDVFTDEDAYDVHVESHEHEDEACYCRFCLYRLKKHVTNHVLEGSWGPKKKKIKKKLTPSEAYR